MNSRPKVIVLFELLKHCFSFKSCILQYSNSILISKGFYFRVSILFYHTGVKKKKEKKCILSGIQHSGSADLVFSVCHHHHHRRRISARRTALCLPVFVLTGNICSGPPVVLHVESLALCCEWIDTQSFQQFCLLKLSVALHIEKEMA